MAISSDVGLTFSSARLLSQDFPVTEDHVNFACRASPDAPKMRTIQA